MTLAFRNCRLPYLHYPKIRQTLSAESVIQIGQTLSDEFPSGRSTRAIRQPQVAELIRKIGSPVSDKPTLSSCSPRIPATLSPEFLADRKTRVELLRLQAKHVSAKSERSERERSFPLEGGKGRMGVIKDTRTNDFTPTSILPRQGGGEIFLSALSRRISERLGLLPRVVQSSTGNECLRVPSRLWLRDDAYRYEADSDRQPGERAGAAVPRVMDLRCV